MKKILLLAVLAACGGDSSSPSKTPDAGQALRCIDFAYCSTYSVKRYAGSVGTPAGGKITDGVYRLAWVVYPSNITDTSTTDYAWALRFGGGTFVEGDSGYRGNLAIDGTKLTLNGTAHCDLGTESTGTNTYTYEFTASENELHLFSKVTRSDGSMWTEEKVLIRTDSVCDAVSSVPSAPGDSYRCTVTNCVCRSAIGNTVSSCT